MEDCAKVALNLLKKHLKDRLGLIKELSCCRLAKNQHVVRKWGRVKTKKRRPVKGGGSKVTPARYCVGTVPVK